MGLSSSQARLLTLTARMHQIEYKAAKLEAQKLQMANESRRVYDEYLEALDLTKIQKQTLNNDGSVKYIDATYNNLCFNNGGKRFGLVAIENGKPIIPDNIAAKYEANKFDPAAFATAMTGYVPTVIPEFGFDEKYTPPANAEQITPDTNFSIAMGDTKKTTISSTSGITLTLSNGLTTSGYTYNIKSSDGSAQDVTFQYLNNGRLVICGDGLTITSNGSQDDDIILLGNSNVLNTGAGNDIVRVGYTLAQSNFIGKGENNTINTGAGTDHVVLGAHGNTVSNTEDILYLSSSIKSSSSVTGASDEWTWYQSSDANTNAVSQTTNTTEGTSSQGSAGDCRLFSLINSLGKNNNNGNLTDYVTINKSGTNYSVTFNNYTGANNTATVSENEVKNTQNVTGDLTTILIDLAINKLMVQNKDDARLQSSETNETNAFSRADYNTVSLYFFGNRNIDWASNYTDFMTQYQKYSISAPDSGYTNLIVGFKTTNESLGIVSGHAYSVKNVTSNYIEVINPWDDADILRLSINDFQTYYDHSYVFGRGSDTITYQNTSGAQDDPNYGYVVSNYAGGENSDIEWNYFYNLHNKITKAGGYELISAENTGRTDYITNIISGGYAYLLEFDNKTNSFVDTSVAINTSLQEVSDETLLRKAEAKYEADMRKIDAKDRKYDTDLAAIDSERNAIKSEMETLKTVAKDNVERTFKLFG